jgi:hypothetical protein
MLMRVSYERIFLPAITMTLPTELFPATTPQNLLAFQFSAWYPKFASTTMRSKIISPLLPAFLEYLHSDGVFVPEGSENLLVG